MEGDIRHVSEILLVFGNVLCPGDDGVGDVAVAAPADEGHPVSVQAAGVHLAAVLDTLVQDHLSKVSKAGASIVEFQILLPAGSP